SCHFNAGADSRVNNEVNPDQPGGDTTFQLGVPFNGSLGPNYHYKAGSADAGFGGYHDGDFPFRKLADINDRFSVTSDVNDVSGSEGQFGLTNDTVTVVAAPGSDDNDNGPHGSINAHEVADPGQNEEFTYGTDTPHLPTDKNHPSNSGKGSINKQSSNTKGRGKVGGSTAANATSVESTTPVVDP